MPEKKVPRAYDTEQLTKNMDIWDKDVAPKINISISDKIYGSDEVSVAALLEAVFGNSPYLSRSVIRNPDCLTEIARSGADAAWQRFIRDFEREIADLSTDTAVLKSALRRQKERAALYIALADISGQWNALDVIKHLSEFADKCVAFTLSSLIQVEVEKGNFRPVNPTSPDLANGIFILALGKLGARELNYSSDIDLMVLFDKELPNYCGKKSPQEFAVKLTKALISILDDRTADGYVFRTDLRLRPDPGSTSIAVTTETAELYYESWGQNWERSALIKARVIAGDFDLGSTFLRNLEPFIWRKSLDFYAIQDIHSIKRQIYAAKGGAEINLLGHDIKTGRGGIREIEFFAQIQQLIWGGRNPDLRVAPTISSLESLEQHNLIESNVVSELTDSYLFLRDLEHRMQMTNDEQTQKIPSANANAEALAIFSGFNSLDSFEETVTHHLRQVERHYADLFEDAPKLTVEGNLVFTGAEHDPDTLVTLKNMGFENPETVSNTVRAWHVGRYRATKSTRSRQILTELIPSMLSAFSQTSQPDRAFVKFDDFLKQLPAGVQLFSIFHSHPEVLGLLAEIMGDAPRLADHLTASSARLDYVLDPRFFEHLPSKSELSGELVSAIDNANSFEEKLDACRRWTNDLRFRVGIQVLRSLITPVEGAKTLSAIADVTIGTLLPHVSSEFEDKFGCMKNGDIAILAYGKLGSEELTPTSDLDIVIIYDCPEDDVSINGERTLEASVYFMRLAQRIISALTVRTAEGPLYEIDLRLRPSGAQGPIAASLKAFEKYQLQEAWAWEHLALSKARVIYSTGQLATKISRVIETTLSEAIDTSTLATSIAEMRARIREQNQSEATWDIKHMPGGLLDTEFIIQYYVLLNYEKAKTSQSTQATQYLEQLSLNNLIDKDTCNILRQALSLWANTLWLYRLTLGSFNPANEISPGLEKRLLDVTKSSSMEDLLHNIRDTASSISEIYASAIEKNSRN